MSLCIQVHCIFFFFLHLILESHSWFEISLISLPQISVLQAEFWLQHTMLMNRPLRIKTVCLQCFHGTNY